MAIALRKTLAIAALALTASFLPAGGAGASETARSDVRTPNLYCLANAWGNPGVSVKPCNGGDIGQYWSVSGEQIALANAKGYCLANTWGAADVSVKPCNAGDQGQYWTITGQQLTLTFAPAYCLANAWGTPNISTKPCDRADRGQAWVVFDNQISLAAA
ncbi:ricin-type beta-trefoil lectin domain protein [Kitasatospora sp. NPDC093806]|uniref:ricin-type beta-trefoil lectin domain protein n=1 Tax=Kitasatospora sp. NPDC093806 TaxID=3155075 RepID=UPI00344AEA21